MTLNRLILKMVRSLIFIKGLLFLAAPVLGNISYPPIPEDLTTPFQVRLAVNGQNGKELAAIKTK